MSNTLDLDVARKDELPQTFTSQDVEDIKAEIDIPRANVTILNTVYSPEETKVGVWREYRTVEGQQVLMEKPLYRKVVSFSGTWSGGLDQVLGTIDGYSDMYIESVVATNRRHSEHGAHSNMDHVHTGGTNYMTGYYIQNNGVVYTCVGSSESVINPSFDIIYIKNSDEWEVVE